MMNLIFLRNSYALSLIIAALLCSGCQTIDRPEQLRAVRREIAQCNDDLNNFLQIPSYCARSSENRELSNKAIDGIIAIVGEPNSEEKAYALTLDLTSVTDVISNAISTIQYREKLFAKEKTAESALTTDFHRYARQANTFRKIKWMSFSAIAILATFVILRKIL
jgi:hypothetical protein